MTANKINISSSSGGGTGEDDDDDDDNDNNNYRLPKFELMKFKNKNPSIDHPSHNQQQTSTKSSFNDNNPMNIDNNHGHHHPKHSKQKNKTMNIIKDNDGHNVITKCDPSSLSSSSKSSSSKTNKCHTNIILKQRHRMNQKETRIEQQQQEEKNQKFSICNNIHGDDDQAQNNNRKTVPKTSSSSNSSKIDDNTGTEKIKSPRSRSRQRSNVQQYLNQKQQQQTSPSSSSNKTNHHSLNNSKKIDDFCHDNHCQQNDDQKQKSTDIDHKQSISSTPTKCLTKKKSKNKIMIDNEINPTDFDCNNQYVDQPQQHEPLSQVLVTLKSQNQNLIKEVEDLRIKLEDAEGKIVNHINLIDKKQNKKKNLINRSD